MNEDQIRKKKTILGLNDEIKNYQNFYRRSIEKNQKLKEKGSN